MLPQNAVRCVRAHPFPLPSPCQTTSGLLLGTGTSKHWIFKFLLGLYQHSVAAQNRHPVTASRTFPWDFRREPRTLISPLEMDKTFKKE